MLAVPGNTCMVCFVVIIEFDDKLAELMMTSSQR